MKILIMMLLTALAGFRQEQQQPIQDVHLLLGKQVIVQREPLCQPATFTTVLAYAGKEAKVVSLKPSKKFANLPQSVLARMEPTARARIEDMQKAATILVQFKDGTELDTCAPLDPGRLSDYFELVPGQSLQQPVAQNSPAPDRPSESLPPSAGAFYKKATGWQQLEELSMFGGGLKHVGKLFVPGLTPQMVWTFRGAEAPIQIEDRRPTFYVKELPGSARDLLIVRFDKKKDHRELQTTSGGNMFTFKSGLSKDRMPDTTAKEIEGGILAITPTADLKPGEYMLTFQATGVSGYDFGIK